MIAVVLVDNVSRWSVLAFASVHVLGLLTHHPVPWSATLTAASLLVVAVAATVRAATGALRSLALLVGLTAAAGLVAEVEYRGGGLGWPFFLTESPADGGVAWVEATLLTTAVLGLSAAALLPEHGAEDRLRALRARLATRLRTWYADRRTSVLDLLEPPAHPDPGAASPVVLDLGVLAPHAPATAPAPRAAGARPRRGLGWWRPRLVATGVVAVTALVAAVATRPMWQADHFGQILVVDSRDRAGLLLATAPVLLAGLAATVVACLSLRRPFRWGVALAAAAVVALAVPVFWARGGEWRYSAEPPPAPLMLFSYTFVASANDAGGLPPRQVHPRQDLDTAAPDGPAGWTDGSWWSDPFDWAEAGDGVLAGVAVVGFLALTVALLPPPRRRDLLPDPLP